jgi:hypothetical protein
MRGSRIFKGFSLILVYLLSLPLMAGIEVYLVENNAEVEVRYRCTTGEQVRFFNLDLRVAKGIFTAVAPALRGESTAATPGYGIFPAAFRDLQMEPDVNGVVDWSDPDYLPVAPATDAQGSTLTGLQSAGMTLEFGSLWNVNRPGDAPPAEGLLCTLTLSEPSSITVVANSIRGGVVLTEGTTAPNVTFHSLDLTTPRIISINHIGETITINFEGGELYTTTDLKGNWTPTGNSSGEHIVSTLSAKQSFFRVIKP